MPGPWIRGLLSAALLLSAVACSGDVPSTASAPDALEARQTGVKLVLVSGGEQVGVPGHALAEPVVVRVLDRRGAPIAGARVNFLASAEGIADPRQTSTDADGYARTTWTLLSPGPQTLRASGVGGTVLVGATAQPGTGATHALVKTGGDGQKGAAGARLPALLEVRVLRDDGTPVGGAPVAWTVATGGGSVNRGTVQTSPTGHARVRWTLGMEPGEQTVVASTAGADPVTFTAKAPGTTMPKPVSLDLEPDSLVLDVGQTGQFTAVVRDKDGAELPGHTPEWSSSDGAVATVGADGTVHAVAPGTAQVTAKVGALSASATVRVRTPDPGITVPLIQNRVSSTGGPIDVSTRDVTLNFWIHTSERDVSGVTMRVRSPAGGVIDCEGMDAENWFRNEFRCWLTIPRGSAPGLWRVDRVTVSKNGQTREFSRTELDAIGTNGRAFDVYGSGTDTQPPQIRVVWPHGRDSSSPAWYWIQVGVVDHVVGVQSVQATLRGPGGQVVSCNAHSSNGALARIADWYCRLPIPAGSGRWNLVSVTVQDGAGNSVTYTPQQIDQWRGMFELTFLEYEFDS